VMVDAHRSNVREQVRTPRFGRSEREVTGARLET
jgi:hypothetical protein